MTDQQRQTYDLWRLINEVEQLLRERGLTPHIAPGQAGNAVGGAGALLRALGITPTADPIAGTILAIDEPWVDRDDRRAEQAASRSRP